MPDHRICPMTRFSMLSWLHAMTRSWRPFRKTSSWSLGFPGALTDYVLTSGKIAQMMEQSYLSMRDAALGTLEM